VHIDLYVALAGLIVGFIVGLTGMGGGALMTPILVLVFNVQPLAAVSSDLVASMIMKPVGSAVHLRRGTVNRTLVLWLMIGSVPSAFAGVLVIKMLGHSSQLQGRLKVLLGLALIVAAVAIVAKGYLQGRAERAGSSGHGDTGSIRVNRPATILVGAIGGLLVGMTSVGSGSLIVAMLLVLYPRLSGSRLVGTDLVQAVPLVTAAALGHILFGDFRLDLTASLLVGSIPGVYAGAKLSAWAPDAVIRPALLLVLMASGLKLLNVGNLELAWSLAAVAAAGGAWWVVSRYRGRMAGDGALVDIPVEVPGA
jgi:uncharacterized membrane protein YfcA